MQLPRGLAFSLPVTCFPKAKSWAGGIAEGWSVLVICRQEASSRAGVDGWAVNGGDGNSIPGAMLMKIGVPWKRLGNSLGHVHDINHLERIPTGSHSLLH